MLEGAPWWHPRLQKWLRESPLGICWNLLHIVLLCRLLLRCDAERMTHVQVLRFANLVFEPLWSRNYIRNVQVIFSEDFGTEGRGGYFDQYGIIRDVIQNHLLQIVSLFAMEAPVGTLAAPMHLLFLC